MFRSAILPLIALSIVLAACDEKIADSDTCGDGVLDPGEACDGESFGSSSCLSLGYYGGILACNACTIVEDACVPFGRCGDGVIQGDNESCDGENIPYTTCASLGYEGDTVVTCGDDCRLDLSTCQGAESCGDGTAQNPEECDGADFQGESCESLGYLGGDLGCGSDCLRDTSGCFMETVCGDGKVQGSERCEATDLDGATCEALGFEGGALACGDDCHFDTGGCEGEGGCGDGILQAPWEACDTDEFAGATCQSLGYNDGYIACTPACDLDLSGCELFGFCGDGVLDAPYETCDGTDLGEITCASLGYSGGTVTCDTDCTGVDDGQCFNVPTCGNGTIDELEECEATDLDGATCRSLGYFAGTLGCSAEGCVYDTSDCRRVVQLAAGEQHTCALDDHGDIWCWGAGDRGVLGNGQTTASATPVRVLPTNLATGEGFSLVSTGARHTCALSTDWKLYCWGRNDSCQVTGADTGDALVPVFSDLFNPATSFGLVTAGRDHTCATNSNGEVFCWGDGSLGQLGRGTTSTCSPPGNAETTTTVIDLVAGEYTTCAQRSGGGIDCWGDNADQALGTGSASPLVGFPEQLLETNLEAGDFLPHLTLGDGYGCGLGYTTGKIYCWGSNPNGRFCSAESTLITTPSVTYTPLYGTPSRISGRASRTCFMKLDGSVRCCGEGPLGNGTSGSSSSPVTVTTPPAGGWQQISAGYDHVCLLDTDGLPWCFGDNTDGQLGDGTTVTRDGPVAVVAP